MSNKLPCLFGFHKYTKRHKTNPEILMCEICMRAGYFKGPNGYEVWYDYDEEGNCVHYRNSDGLDFKVGNVEPPHRN